MNRFDPKAISERVARAVAASGAQPWLIGYDANGIQELITACGRPISMRGASEVILAFDEKTAGDELTIFAGGGRGIALARSEHEARTAVRALVERYREVTRGGVMAACTVPLMQGGDAEAQSIRWLRHRLEIEKDAACPPGGVLPDSKDMECAYCRSYRGAHPRKRDDEIEMVCTRCDAMLGEGRRVGRPSGRGERGEMSRSIADIAQDGWIAVISADGNNLGAMFDSLRNLIELAVLSEAVGMIFHGAHQRALECVPVDMRVPLMTGGDDIRAFIPPAAVLRYVDTLVDVVESSASDHARAIASVVSADVATRLDCLGVGIGTVVANVYYPVWRLVEHAHALERSAKAACYASGWRSGFDFAVVTSEDSMAGELDRAHDIRPVRPRTAVWRNALRNAAALARIPSAQLGVLAAERTLDTAEFGNLFRYQVARSPGWQAWYETCGVDWRIPEDVHARRPDRGLLDLAKLFAHQEASRG